MVQRITDIHVHINPWHRIHKPAYDFLAATQPNLKDVLRLMKDPDALVAVMDAEDIHRVGLINYVSPNVLGYESDVNDWITDYAKDHRDRFWVFGGVDALFKGEDPEAEVERVLSTLEVDGVKVNPPHAWAAANDYECGSGIQRILYERCQDLGVPVMVHTGTSMFPNARNRYGDPMALDDLCVDFPRLKVIMAHGGRPLWTETAFFLMRRHRNLWLDISSIPPKRLLDYFPRIEAIADRVVFGSDWPGPAVKSIRDNADQVAALDLPEDVQSGILYGNAARLMSV